MVICPIASANAMSINENSLICATVNHTIIPFFLLYHILHIRTITINGFPINTNSEKIIIGIIYIDTSENCNCEPRNTKNNTIKKSLSGFILLLISNLYGNDAKVNHARSAPISKENPTASSPAANSRHHAIENINKNSDDLAIYHIIRGSTYLVSRYTATPTAAIFASNTPENAHRLVTTPSTGKEAKTIKITIAIISCTISIPIDILPYNSSNTHLSLKSLTIIIVLLNANAIATYMLVTQSKPSKSAITIPIPVVNTTCHTQTTSEAFHRSLTIAGLSHNHTINSRNATPI